MRLCKSGVDTAKVRRRFREIRETRERGVAQRDRYQWRMDHIFWTMFYIWDVYEDDDSNWNLMKYLNAKLPACAWNNNLGKKYINIYANYLFIIILAGWNKSTLRSFSINSQPINHIYLVYDHEIFLIVSLCFFRYLV